MAQNMQKCRKRVLKITYADTVFVGVFTEAVSDSTLPPFF
jgi:hypothetical protein